MIEEPKTLVLKRPERRPSAAQIAAFQNVPTSFIVDAMYGGGSMATEICALGDHGETVAGPALTVDNRPSDILALLAALDLIAHGDIVVSSVAGFQGCAAAGDRLAGMMKNNGAAGFVTDGPMRDLDGIKSVGLPCWCTGLNPGSPFSTGPGRAGLPIEIAGCHVESGDMIVADKDGVVVVPFAQIEAVISRLAQVRELEAALDDEVAQGRKIPDAVRDLLDSDAVDWV